MKKEIEEDIKRWKDLPCVCIDRISIVKIGHFIDRLNAVTIKFQHNSFPVLKNNTQFHIKITKTQDS